MSRSFLLPQLDKQGGWAPPVRAASNPPCPCPCLPCPCRCLRALALCPCRPPRSQRTFRAANRSGSESGSD
eukprot:8643881-Pyramimonas_sp.AAC.1